MKTLFANLDKRIEGDVLLDEYSLGMYATDASIYQIKPIAIVLPKTNNDVKLAIKLASENGITILPRGAGTSLAGQTVGDSMILDFSKYMNRIIEINEVEKWVRCSARHGKRRFKRCFKTIQSSFCSRSSNQ